VITNSFPVLQALGEQMRSCSRGNIAVETRVTAEYLPQVRVALQAGGNSPFQVIQVSNGSFTEFANRNYLQPIGDLVRKHASQYQLSDIPQGLWDQTVHDGQIHAVPFQMNVEQLFYRKDILDKHSIAVPRTIEEMVRAAQVIKERETSIEFPIAGIFGRGWNVATEFGNMYQSLGGTWFDERGQPRFNDANGVRVIEAMRSMLPYMSPNALAHTTDDVMVAFQQGRSALGICWATRAANMDAPDVSRVRGQVQFAVAPAVAAGGSPSSALWWDGYVLPRTINVDRELAFLVIAEAMKPEVMRSVANLTYLSRQSITSDPQLVAANRYWAALGESLTQGARIFPARPYFNLAHTAIGAGIIDALQGRVPPKDALDRVAETYVREARSQGFF
jgi:multiple sugar transport system substrate-binding protein